MCAAVAVWESLQLLAERDTHIGSSGKSTPVGVLPAHSRAGLWLGLVWSWRRLFIFKVVFKISLFFLNKSVSFLHFRCTASLIYPEGLARLVPYPIWEPPSSRKCPGPSSREYALQVTRVPPPPSSAPEVTGGVSLWTLCPVLC